jgi:hypothetical protein
MKVVTDIKCKLLILHIFVFVLIHLHNVLICFEECGAETTKNNSSQKSLDEQVPIKSSVKEQVTGTIENNCSQKSLDEQVPINSSVEEQVPTDKPAGISFILIHFLNIILCSLNFMLIHLLHVLIIFFQNCPRHSTNNWLPKECGTGSPPQ